MKTVETDLPEVLLIETETFDDNRGFFRETYQQEKFSALGLDVTFVQDNLSHSKKNVLRGLHFQEPRSQGKLVQVIQGEIFDVVVDVRQGSPGSGQWIGVALSAVAGNMLWVPQGFAHGFAVLSDSAEVLYKVTDFWAPETEQVIRWDDPDIGIDWPVSNPILAEKDAQAPTLAAAKVLPHYRP